VRTIFFFVDQLIGFKGSSAASRPGGRAGLAPAEGGAGSGSSAAASVPKPPRSCFSTSSSTVAGAFSCVVVRDEVESLMCAGWAKRRLADSGGEQEREQGVGQPDEPSTTPPLARGVLHGLQARSIMYRSCRAAPRAAPGGDERDRRSDDRRRAGEEPVDEQVRSLRKPALSRALVHPVLASRSRGRSASAEAGVGELERSRRTHLRRPAQTSPNEQSALPVLFTRHSTPQSSVLEHR